MSIDTGFISLESCWHLAYGNIVPKCPLILKKVFLTDSISAFNERSRIPLLSTSGTDRKLTGLFDGIDNCSYYSKRRFCGVEAHLRACLGLTASL